MVPGPRDNVDARIASIPDDERRRLMMIVSAYRTALKQADDKGLPTAPILMRIEAIEAQLR